MAGPPGTPALLRTINDRSALELLLSVGPLSRAQLGELTGLSKVTASQMLGRLQALGLVQVVGSTSGRRGPSAEIYGVVPGCAHVVALEVGPDAATAAVCDVTGAVLAEVAVDMTDAADPVRVVHGAVVKAARRAGVGLAQVTEVVIGTPGLVDPTTGDVGFSFDLPEWHAGLRAALRRDLRRPVTIENDVNLAAVAEQHEGAAKGVNDFVLFWVGRGLGVAVVLDGRLHRGSSGAAGEVGYLPVPGVPLPTSVSRPDKGAFQRLVGADVVAELARSHGLPARDAEEAVTAAAAAGSAGEVFLGELSERLAVGVAAVCAVLDPGLVVLTGGIGRAGGQALADRVGDAVARIAPVHPKVLISEVAVAPVLRGAMLTGLAAAREALVAASTDEAPTSR